MEYDDGNRYQRPVVLVFHESSQDVKYLKALGYDIHRLSNVIDLVDTREMHQYITQRQNPTSLGSVLDFLGILSNHLHNAGNDAAFTMRAMIGLAVGKRLMSLESTGKKIA